MELTKKKCVPCEGGIPKLSRDQAEELIKQVQGWELHGEQIRKTFHFKGFKRAMGFVVQMGLVAETEGHHPDFCVHYKDVEVSIWTHAINGLSENDFILAAKLDAIIEKPS